MGIKTIMRKGGRRFRIYWTTEDGKERKRMLPKGTTKEEAEAALTKQKQRVGDVKDGFAVRDRNPHNLTVAATTKRWLKGKDDRLVNQVTNHIVETALGGVSIDKVTSEMILEHIEALQPMPPTKGAKARTEPLSAATRNHVRKHLVQIFEYALGRKLLVGLPNPALAVKPGKVDRRDLTTYTAAECARLVNAVEQPWRGILAVALHALRKGEVWGLDGADIDLERDVIHVRRSHSKPFPKSGRARVVPIIPDLRAALVEAVELAQGRSTPLFPGLDPDKKPGELLTKRRNERASVEYAYHRAIRLAKIGRVIRFHDLRHTTATLLLQAGVPIVHVSKILGHSSIAVTVDLYGHLQVDDLRVAMAALSFDLPAPKAVRGTR
jgi:integrase